MSTWANYWRKPSEQPQKAKENPFRKKLSLADWESFLYHQLYQADTSKRQNAIIGVITIFFLIAVVFLLSSTPLVSVIFFALAVVFLLIRFKNKQKNEQINEWITLKSEIRSFILPMILYLKNDVWEETMVDMEVTPLKNYLKKLNKDETFYKAKKEFVPFLKVKTRLMDGSLVIYRVMVAGFQKTFTSYGKISGKTKYKTKYRIHIRYKMAMEWDRRRYRMEDIEVPQTFQLKGKSKSKQITPVFNPADFSKTFAPAYSILSKAKNVA